MNGAKTSAVISSGVLYGLLAFVRTAMRNSSICNATRGSHHMNFRRVRAGGREVAKSTWLVCLRNKLPRDLRRLIWRRVYAQWWQAQLHYEQHREHGMWQVSKHIFEAVLLHIEAFVSRATPRTRRRLCNTRAMLPCGCGKFWDHGVSRHVTWHRPL